MKSIRCPLGEPMLPARPVAAGAASAGGAPPTSVDAPTRAMVTAAAIVARRRVRDVNAGFSAASGDDIVRLKKELTWVSNPIRV
ncbi:hypothetical protein CLE01_14070 [Cryobacterium levicorallinum]|nr:hypothetical protein CLE01_14070 [Cryobacterium levicorallinum]